MEAVKKMTWKTNYNRKMGCPGFIHLDIVPTGIPFSIFGQVFAIETEDNSHPPVSVELVDIAKTTVEKLHNIDTISSHGMDKYDFLQHIREKVPNLNNDTVLGIYMYKRIQIQ